MSTSMELAQPAAAGKVETAPSARGLRELMRFRQFVGAHKGCFSTVQICGARETSDDDKRLARDVVFTAAFGASFVCAKLLAAKIGRQARISNERQLIATSFLFEFFQEPS